MTDEKQLALVRDFPKFFRDYNGDLKVTCMAWGIEHGDGWEKPLRELCTLIKYYIDLHPPNFLIDFKWSQIKEKYGTPRWYYDGGDDIINILVSHYENKASQLCEVCGKYGSIRGKTWVYTACDEHTRLEDK